MTPLNHEYTYRSDNCAHSQKSTWYSIEYTVYTSVLVCHLPTGLVRDLHMHWHATSTHVRQTHMGSDDLVFMSAAALPCMPACTLTKPQQLTTAHCCSVTVTVKQLSCAQCNSIPEERTAVPAAPALCCAARQLGMPQHAQRDSSLPARLHLLPWVSAASASTPALIYTHAVQ